MTTLNTFIDTYSPGDLVLDTFTPLKGAGTDLGASYDSGDGTHPNATGNTAIANVITTDGTIL